MTEQVLTSLQFRRFVGFVFWSVLLTAICYVSWSLLRAWLKTECFPNCDFDPLVLGHLFSIGMFVAVQFSIPVFFVSLTFGFLVWRRMLTAGVSFSVAAVFCAAIACFSLVVYLEFRGNSSSLSAVSFDLTTMMRSFLRYFVFAAPVALIVARWRYSYA